MKILGIKIKTSQIIFLPEIKESTIIQKLYWSKKIKF